MSQNDHFLKPYLDLREEDNLSIVDKMAGPNVSFIQRLPCIYKLNRSIHSINAAAFENKKYIYYDYDTTWMMT